MKNRYERDKVVKEVCRGKHSSCSKTRHCQQKFTGSQILAYASSDTMYPTSTESLPSEFKLEGELLVCINLKKSLKYFLREMQLDRPNRMNVSTGSVCS